MEGRYPHSQEALLGQLIEEGTVNAQVLDKLLGAYTIFEYREGKCFRKQASASYLKMLYRDDADAQSSWEGDLMEAVAEEDRAEFSRVLAEGSGERSRCRFRHLTKKGISIFLDMELILLKKDTGALYLGILRDVTEEYQTSSDYKVFRGALQTILHISEDDMNGQGNFLQPNRPEIDSLLADVLPVGIHGSYCEKGLPLYFASEEMVRMLGYDSYEEMYAAVQGKAINTVYREDMERLSEELSHTYCLGYEYTVTYRMPRKDGSLFWVLDKGRTVQTDDGRLALLSFCMDITDTMGKLEAAQEKLREENREHLDMIYALSRDYYAVWKLDLDRDILLLRRSENMKNYGVTGKGQYDPCLYSESLKQYAQDRIHPDDRRKLLEEASLENIRERLETMDAFSVRIRQRAEGDEHYTYVELRVIRMAGSTNTHAALIALRDVDGDVLAEEKRQALLKDALSAAEHASRAKTTFLSNMSHDIRTPMNAIIGFTSIAASHLDNKERVKDCLEKIMSSSNHLLSLINDILDMSRIESGRVTIQEKECNLSERIHNLVNMIRPQMRAKRLEFFVDTIDVRDEDLIFDPLRLDQILINILSNAVKFTPSGGTVTFTIRQSDSDKPGYGHYEFIIKDTGIGMSESFQKRIYSPFEREKSSTISGIEGTGLGMAITKNTVDMMGGTIEIQSQLNHGSTFTVALDFKRQDIARRQTELKELQGLRALVVDDDFNICDSVTGMLSQIGMRSEWTTSGREAVFRAQKAHNDGDPFHSYLVDWLMPGMDGIETVRQIRKVIGDEAPIIILTAYDWTDIEEEARAAGVTAFCNKPLFLSDLRKVLAETGSCGRQKCAEQEKEEGIPSEAAPRRRVLVAEDNELNQEIVTEFLRVGGYEAETASDGSIAVEMVRKSEEGYYDLILMDIQMPVMDGYEAAREIRYLPRKDAARIPIIAMTANAFEEDKERALQNGMNAHIAKPLDMKTLTSVLDRIVRKQS